MTYVPNRSVPTNERAYQPMKQPGRSDSEVRES